MVKMNEAEESEGCENYYVYIQLLECILSTEIVVRQMAKLNLSVLCFLPIHVSATCHCH